MKKLVVPKFATESAEAKWWHDQKDIVEDNLFEAIKNGAAAHGTPRRLMREACESKRKGHE
jgi:hypothetical protein